MDRLAAEEEPTDVRSRQPWETPETPETPVGAEPDASERITLIEFMWQGTTGAQQVILVSREWLQ
jgi:hypothetical protein